MSSPKAGSCTCRDWFYVVLWTVIIYLTLPFGPDIVNFLKKFMNTDYQGIGWQAAVFLIFSIGIFLDVLLIRFVTEVKGVAVRVMWLIPVLAVYTYLMNTMKVPTEKIHFIEYGVLAILLFKALKNSTRSSLIYVQIFFIGFLIGMSDELIQWFLPNRSGEFIDVIWNVTSVSLVIILISKTWKPDWLEPVSRKSEVRTTAVIGVITLLAIPAFIQTTSLFGFFYDTGAGQSFKSYLSSKELEAKDKNDGKMAGALIKNGINENYSAWLTAHPQPEFPLAHEARVHIFRRDRQIQLLNHYSLMNALIEMHKRNELNTTVKSMFEELTFAHPYTGRLMERYAVKYTSSWLKDQDKPLIFTKAVAKKYVSILAAKAENGRAPKQDDSLNEYISIARNENEILMRYFNQTLEHSGQKWPAELQKDLYASVSKQERLRLYHSPVSTQLITILRPPGLWLIGFISIIVLIFVSRIIHNRSN